MANIEKDGQEVVGEFFFMSIIGITRKWVRQRRFVQSGLLAQFVAYDADRNAIKKRFRNGEKYHPDTGAWKFIELMENYKKLVE